MLANPHRPTQFLRPALLVALLAGLACSGARAQTFTESGDANGLIPGTPTVGPGAVTRITGSLGASDGDLYAIRITNPAAFSATTVAQTALDTQLFLFNSVGRGVVACDDAAIGVFQSAIGGALVSEPGVYYLLITSYDVDPAFNGAQMWNDMPFIGQRAPDGPAATGTFNSYSGSGGAAGPYGIMLSGAEFVTNTLDTCPPTMNPEQIMPVGDGPSDLVLADFNSDGRLDVATSNYLGHSTTVQFGTGDGTFAGGFTAANAASNPQAIAAGDFNRDGRLDLVVANFGSSNVSVRLNSSTGFQSTLSHTFTGSNPTDVAVADINRDGIDDLVVANASSQNIVVLNGLGNGAGSFATAVPYALGTNPSAVALADLDLDGVVDAAVATVSGIRVLRGHPNGTFQAPVAVTSTAADSITIGDLNRDGKPDIAAANYPSDTLSIILGTGSIASFQSPTVYATEDGPGSVNIADINNDGEPDVIVGHGLVYYTQFFLGTGGGSLRTSAFTGLAGASREAIADVNNDGRLDIVGALSPSDAIISIMQNAAPALPAIIGQPSPRSIQVGQNASFSITLAETLLVETIRWRRNGVPLFDDLTHTGVATPTLVVSNAGMIDNGAVYDCFVTSTCGSTTSRAVSLTVSPSCTADFNRDGGLTSQDFFDFLAAFFTGCP